MQLTKKEVILAILFAILGYFFYTRTYLLFLNELNPVFGLIIYMAVTYTCIYLLSRADLVVFGYKIKTVSQTIGLFMITFAFYIVVGWSNEYVQFVTTGGWQGASVLFMQCEDGVSWWLISLLIQPVNPLLIWK
jgi:hypothetical protein